MKKIFYKLGIVLGVKPKTVLRNFEEIWFIIFFKFCVLTILSIGGMILTIQSSLWLLSGVLFCFLTARRLLKHYINIVNISRGYNKKYFIMEIRIKNFKNNVYWLFATIFFIEVFLLFDFKGLLPWII